MRPYFRQVAGQLVLGSIREENHTMRQSRGLFTTLGALLAMIGAIMPAWAGKLIVIANDGKEPHRDGSYSVLASPQPDSIVILDASTFPRGSWPRSPMYRTATAGRHKACA